jgi:hypothetical protein
MAGQSLATYVVVVGDVSIIALGVHYKLMANSWQIAV